MGQAGAMTGLRVGVKVKEIATPDIVYRDCNILHSDAVGLVFEVHRTVSDGGMISSVVSQLLVPWTTVRYILVLEEEV
jgi:hypothetical protein